MGRRMSDKYGHLLLPVPRFVDVAQATYMGYAPYPSTLVQVAMAFAREHMITKSNVLDGKRVGLALIDMSGSFCNPYGELFVRGRTGNAGLVDAVRTVKLGYKLARILTDVLVSLDLHHKYQTSVTSGWVDARTRRIVGDFTPILLRDLEERRYYPNPDAIMNIVRVVREAKDPRWLDAFLKHSAKTLEARGSSLYAWPEHSLEMTLDQKLLGILGEMLDVLRIWRGITPITILKGSHPLTDAMSPIEDDILMTHEGRPLPGAIRRTKLVLAMLQDWHRIVVCGEAETHCVLRFVQSLIRIALEQKHPEWIRKIVMMRDCMSPVVVPGGPDYAARVAPEFEELERLGVQMSSSSDSIESWMD